MPKSCVAVNCSNHNFMKEKNLTFHIFPKKEKFRDRWEKWVQACKKVNADGSKWEPKGRYVYLCSEHFITKKPNSSDPNHPDYVPSVFPTRSKNEVKDSKKIDRYNSSKKRKKQAELASSSKVLLVTPQYQDQEPIIKPDPVFLGPEIPTIGPDPVHFNAFCNVKDDDNDDSQLIFNSGSCETPKKPEEMINKSLLMEMDFLRAEKIALQTRIHCLEEQVLLSKYDPKKMEFNDTATKFFTGLCWSVYASLCQYVKPFLKAPQKYLPLENQITLFLARIRLNLPLKFLSYQVGQSVSTVHSTFHKILDLIYQKLGFLVAIQDREYIHKTLPPVFKQNFPKLTHIFDCFEIFIDHPERLKPRAQVYSNYKKHSTVKYFISCSPLGAVNFLSSGYGGRASDVHIVRESGFISSKYHCPGDQLLADRGFTLKEDFAAECSVELLIPSFTKGQKQLTAKEVEITRKIANVRIHIERVIGEIKNRYNILNGPLPITFIKSLEDEIGNEVPSIDKLVTVCAALINLSTGIIYNEDE